MAKKKAKKKTAKRGGKQRETLVVASKVKSHIKSMDMNTSAEAIQALSERVYCMLDAAAERTRANGRKTVKAQDV